jgi:hypothetical protein
MRASWDKWNKQRIGAQGVSHVEGDFGRIMGSYGRTSRACSSTRGTFSSTRRWQERRHVRAGGFPADVYRPGQLALQALHHLQVLHQQVEKAILPGTCGSVHPTIQVNISAIE